MRKRVLLLALMAGSLVYGCTKKELKSVKPPVAVELAVAETGRLVEGIEVTGVLEPKFSADIKSQLAGLVTKVYVTQWVKVRKGDPLLQIDTSEASALTSRAEASVAAAKAQLAKGEALLERAVREEERMTRLKESGLATRQQLDQSRTELKAARAELEAARGQLKVASQELNHSQVRQERGIIRSPLDGAVAMRDINVGDLASDAAVGKSIFRIVDNRLLNLTVTVPSADSARVKVGQQLQFFVESLPGENFNGRVMFINPELTPGDRSLKVVAEVQNSQERLKGGLFARGRIITGSREDILQIPRSALDHFDTIQGGATIFVAEGETVRQRKVRTGTVNGELVEILEGLKRGERYVSRGSFTLRDGDRITVRTGITGL